MEFIYVSETNLEMESNPNSDSKTEVDVSVQFLPNFNSKNKLQKMVLDYYCRSIETWIKLAKELIDEFSSKEMRSNFLKKKITERMLIFRNFKRIISQNYDILNENIENDSILEENQGESDENSIFVSSESDIFQDLDEENRNNNNNNNNNNNQIIEQNENFIDSNSHSREIEELKKQVELSIKKVENFEKIIFGENYELFKSASNFLRNFEKKKIEILETQQELEMNAIKNANENENENENNNSKKIAITITSICLIIISSVYIFRKFKRK
ncbi:hypothetical protein M0811_11796 [Anaeramoeba ignava]|uniref:Uncharacterized protein n=1 Tax=Anaeramoeba ignava TaxID=1746090 RepID=A0A9Q0R7C1_ANAIG|nr:hypothetical protein M0811_11796 [Anaeramoeba ignava]